MNNNNNSQSTSNIDAIFGFSPNITGIMTPTSYPNPDNNDGVMQITPVSIIKTKIIHNININNNINNNDKIMPLITTLQPLEDVDTDVSSQIASSDLPSTDIPQPPNDNNNENKN